MAIVFNSPEKKQTTALWITMLVSVVFMGALSVIIFVPEFLPKNPNTLQASFLPEVKINAAILDSDKIKNLEPVGPLPSPEVEIGRENPFASY